MTGGLHVVYCDFNAWGWSEEKDDNCYYVFEKEAFALLEPTVGKRVIIYMESTEQTCIACEGVLERWQDRWRARPDESTWEEIDNSEIERLKNAVQKE
jgi:hypothetical protein